MKKVLLAGLMLVLGGALEVWAQSSLDKPLAVVRLTRTEQIGSKFFYKQLDVIQKQLNTPLDASKKRQLLDTRVDAVLIEQAAERDKVTVSDTEVASAIAQQKNSLGQQMSDDNFRKLVTQQTGFTWEEYTNAARDGLLQQRYLMAKRPQLGTTKFTVSESEITDTYEQQAQKFVSPTLIRFNFISVDTKGKDAAAKSAAKAKIDEFARQIKSGGQAAFDDLMKKSLDSTTYRGDDSNYIMKGEPNAVAFFGKSFLDTAFGMSLNSISPVLEASYGYYIIMITDKRNPKLIGIDDPLYPGQKLTPREQIRQALISQKQSEAVQKAMDEIIKELRKQAEISYIEKNFGW